MDQNIIHHILNTFDEVKDASNGRRLKLSDEVIATLTSAAIIRETYGWYEERDNNRGA
jgi:hypothetical protein